MDPVWCSQIAQCFNLSLNLTLLKARIGKVVMVASVPLECARDLCPQGRACGNLVTKLSSRRIQIASIRARFFSSS